jgi:hypothetical protein
MTGALNSSRSQEYVELYARFSVRLIGFRRNNFIFTSYVWHWHKIKLLSVQSETSENKMSPKYE